MILPLVADFTTAKIPDNQMYTVLITSLSVTIIKRTCYMAADPGYDDLELYVLSKDMEFRFMCPVHKFKIPLLSG